MNKLKSAVPKSLVGLQTHMYNCLFKTSVQKASKINLHTIKFLNSFDVPALKTLFPGTIPFIKSYDKKYYGATRGQEPSQSPFS